MKRQFADFVFALGWVAVGSAVAWSRRRRRQKIAQPDTAPVDGSPAELGSLPDGPADNTHDLVALAEAAGNSMAPRPCEAVPAGENQA